MKLPFLFKSTEATSSWPWPTCGNPKTLSFRAGDDIFKTINSAYMGSTVEVAKGYTQNPEVEFDDKFDESTSFCYNNQETGEKWSIPMALEEPRSESIEMVIQGLQSERLFFELGETSSIMEEAKTDEFSFKESHVVMAMDSWDPVLDFKRSMEEMVEAYGLKDWDFLEELLSWYLRVNEESSHCHIVGAFVELLIGPSSSTFDGHCSTITHSFNSPLSFTSSSSSTYTTTPCISSLEAEEEIEKTVDNASSSDV